MHTELATAPDFTLQRHSRQPGDCERSPQQVSVQTSTELRFMSKPARPHIVDDVASNVALLDAFWRRSPFHDMEITSINRLSGRVVVSVGSYFLVLIGATRYEGRLDRMPDVWLYDAMETVNDGRVLTVETESGKFVVAFRNLRLIRQDDYAVLIPPLDS
jgi:hypothetical protein